MTDPVETPSGKGSGDENFPVGSWLLPAGLRPHVAKFYAFARAIDDIADSPDLTPDDKIRRLNGFDAALAGAAGAAGADDPAYAKAHRLRDSLRATGVTDRHGRDLIAAFRQDAVKLRYDDWADLMGYCRLSAAPVGRYLLDLHGQPAADYGPSDALCNALQVLNHLQDCREDYRRLDRVYLPMDWLDEYGVDVPDLDEPEAGIGLRLVLDRCLDGCDALLAEARVLPGRLYSRRLAMESAVIVRLARRLTRLLRRGDPLAERVALTRADFARCGLTGAAAGLFARPGRRGAEPHRRRADRAV
jgi:squalene synthase HpnC